MDKVRVLIDTDLGDDVDDAAAFMLALSWGAIEIAGVTTVFKDTKKRAGMVKDLLALYGRDDIPVCAGYGNPIVGDSRTGFEEPIQYGLLKGRVEPEEHSMVHAEDFIIQKVKEDRNLIILAMGAMTNLAMAFLKEPALMREVRIIGMGGSFLNSSPEWNILCDPEAASIVMERSGRLIMMGLDVTKFLAYLIDSRVVTLKKGHFAVELSGRLTRGTMVDMTNYYEINPEVETDFQFAQSVDLERFYRIVDTYF